MFGTPPAQLMEKPTASDSAMKGECSKRAEDNRTKSDTFDLATISVSAKLPEFWVDMPRLWFMQFEAVMAPQKQGDEGKYNMVVAKLGRDSIQQVSDILTSPPTSDKYKTLKERLLQVYEESSERQFQKLVSELELGAQKPTQLLRRMKDLGRTTQASEQTLKNLWLTRMPPAVRAVITVCQDQSLESLAQIADKVIENSRRQEIAEVASVSEQRMEGTITELVSQLGKLTLEVAALRTEVKDRGRRAENNYQGFSSRSSSRPRRTPTDPGWLCRFHYRWRRYARNCEQPCAWRKDNSEN